MLFFFQTAAVQASHAQSAGSVGSAPRSRRVSHASQLSSGAIGSPLPVFSPPRLDFSFFTPASTSGSMLGWCSLPSLNIACFQGLNSGYHPQSGNSAHFLGYSLNNQPNFAQLPIPSAPIEVQLCEAWKNFKVNEKLDVESSGINYALWCQVKTISRDFIKTWKKHVTDWLTWLTLWRLYSPRMNDNFLAA